MSIVCSFRWKTGQLEKSNFEIVLIRSKLESIWTYKFRIVIHYQRFRTRFCTIMPWKSGFLLSRKAKICCKVCLRCRAIPRSATARFKLKLLYETSIIWCHTVSLRPKFISNARILILFAHFYLLLSFGVMQIVKIWNQKICNYNQK